MEGITRIAMDIQESIFEYNIVKLIKYFSELIEKVNDIVNSYSDEKLKLINEILNLLNTALDNKDYILLGDIIRYELLPNINKNINDELLNMYLMSEDSEGLN